MSISSTYYVSEALISFDLHYEVGIINRMSQIRTLTDSGLISGSKHTAGKCGTKSKFNMGETHQK